MDAFCSYLATMQEKERAGVQVSGRVEVGMGHRPALGTHMLRGMHLGLRCCETCAGTSFQTDLRLSA